MKDKFEIKGYWFLPNDSENRVAGTLYFAPNEKLTLELIGSFQEPKQRILSRSNSEIQLDKVIHGESSDAKKITLLNCKAGSGSYNFACSFPMESFTADYLIIGTHISDINEPAFNKICVTLPHLTNWVNNYRLDYSIPFKNNKVHGFNLAYDLDRSNVVTIEIDENITLEIMFVCSTPSDLYEEEISIKQSYRLRFINKSNSSFHNLLKLTHKFIDFLSLATLSPIDYTTISLSSSSLYQELKDGRKAYDTISLYYKQQSTQLKIRKSGYLFDHDKISTEFETIIRKWYQFDENMVPILQHLIDSIQPKNYFSKADFLIVIQALEGFHTRFRNRSSINLQNRIKQLYEEFSFIPSINDLQINYQIAADSRHYYSHFFHRDKKEHIADGLELYQMTKSLKIILICCILKETGFSNELINIVMNGNKKIT